MAIMFWLTNVKMSEHKSYNLLAQKSPVVGLRSVVVRALVIKLEDIVIKHMVWRPVVICSVSILLVHSMF